MEFFPLARFESWMASSPLIQGMRMFLGKSLWDEEARLLACYAAFYRAVEPSNGSLAGQG